MKAAQSTERFDFRVHVAMHRVDRIRPPYSPNLAVTPHSVFSDNRWEYPKEAFAAGHREQSAVNFLTPRRLPGGKTLALTPTEHGVLLNELKESVYALIFHRSVLPWRNDAVKPETIVHDSARLCLLFVNIAARGLKSLKELNQQHLDEIFATLPVSGRTRAILVSDFRDLTVLSQLNFLSDPFSAEDLGIELPQIAKDQNERGGARVLTDSEMAFLLGHSTTYIDRAEDIAHQITALKEGNMTPVALVNWAYENLPVQGHLKASHISDQLGWLVKIAGYQHIAFHLGSRASEVLSALDSSIASDVDVGQARDPSISLTVFKGNTVPVLRTYSVHPYITRVGAALRAVTKALGHPPGGPLFSAFGKTELSTSNLNHKLRKFSKMHGWDIGISSHSWRFGLADVVTGSADNPYPAIQYQFGHEFLGEALAYGMKGATGGEIRKAGIEAGFRAVAEFLRECAGEDELGGLQGPAVSEALKSDMTIEEIQSEFSSMGITPFKISPGRYCVKAQHVKGACGRVTGDAAPEIEYCRGDCSKQVQLREVRLKWEDFLISAPKYFSSNDLPVAEKIYKADQLLQDVAAWPQLRLELNRLLDAEPNLKKWFETNGF